VDRARYEAVWRHGLHGPLNYYRASPLRPPVAGDDAVRRIALADAAVSVRVPTRVLWAEDDRALRPGLLRGLDRGVTDRPGPGVGGARPWIGQAPPGTVVPAIVAALAD
jgi:hypothetical protein